MNWYILAQSSEFEFNPKFPVSFSPELRRYLFQNLVNGGFNILSIDDMMSMLDKKNNNGQNYIEYNDEWKKAFEKAVQSIRKRKSTTEKTKSIKNQHPEINWKRLKELGYTNNIYGAGYITPDGKLIDLSEREWGGDPSLRSLDHREVGGYEAMKEFVGMGYIRMHCSKSGYSGLDLSKEPTSQQYNVIFDIVKASFDSIRVDLRKSKDGEYDFIEFKGKTHPMMVINKIKDFYKNKPIKATAQSEKVLIFSRGIPGSGKSTLAKQLAGNSGIVLESDDYFMRNGKYVFDPEKRGEAHEWNQERCLEAMINGISPIVISNTNTMAVEAEPYVRMAISRGYKIRVEEPNWHKELRDSTTGKWNFDFLKGRNIHDVPEDILKTMIDRYENKEDFIKNLKQLIVKK